MIRQLATCIALALPVAAPAASDSFDARLTQACPATAAWAKQAGATQDRIRQQQERYDATHHASAPSLRKDLANRYAADQKARATWIASGYSEASAKAMQRVDASNLAWLKPLIDTAGFPTVAQVGYAGVSHAWMLVQHATGDPALQARVLQSIRHHLESSGISNDGYALLLDRVRVEQGKPQVYGTQFYVPSGKGGKLATNSDGTPDMQMRPLEDAAKVDQRRARMGLMPLADYRCMLRVMYTPSGATGHGPVHSGK